MASVAIEREAGIETIPHLTTRDMSVAGLESLLLGAHAEGLHNILAVTGDPPEEGDYPGARGVYEVDAIGLTRLVSGLNRGEDYHGRGIDAPTSFFVGVAVNPSADDMDLELERFERKLEAGAQFGMTQVLFDLAYLDSFLAHYGGRSPIPLLVGVWPMPSHRLASGRCCGCSRVTSGRGRRPSRLGACRRRTSRPQGALLAPTDLLARQHRDTLRSLLEPLGVSVELLAGVAHRRRPTPRARPRRLRDGAGGRGDARADPGVGAFATLGVVVIDEQHRFGVEQRGLLEAKAGGNDPHVLLMTATPIPRTLGQVLYADLDVSTLRTPPEGRLAVRTAVRHPEDLDRLWMFVRAEAEAGRATFVVVPAIEESEDSRS